MVKFKTSNKGSIAQLFGGNPHMYKGRKINGHNGVDTVIGWDRAVTSDNAGLVYKVITKDQGSDGWQGVYQLVHAGDDKYVEVCQGHFNRINVKEGTYIPELTVIGFEGNKGFVFSGGEQITRAMQDAGDRRGTHTHTSYRPVQRVKTAKRGRFYLQTVTGANYVDNQGWLYEVIHSDNGFKGCVDPMIYKHENSVMENIKAATTFLLWFAI